MDIAGIAGSVVNVVVMIFSILFAGGLAVGAAILYFKYRQYAEFDCVIWDEEGNQSTDKAGIFVDKKTNNKRFYMKKNNVGLSPDNVPYRRTGNKKIVYLVQNGLKNFSFVKVAVSNPTVNLSVMEEDVNWAINAYDRQKKLFQHSLLIQMLPYMALVFVSMVILILFYYLFKKFDVIGGVASSLADAAKSIAQAKAGVIT